MTNENTSFTRRRILGASLTAATAVGLTSPSRAEAKSGRATFVLVHGAWHGGWCWRRVVDRLAARQHFVVAPTLSGVGERSHLAGDAINLTTQINDVVNEIKWKDLDRIVLVGHSYGGCVVTGVAEQLRERIASIVYLDAFIPLDGQSAADLSGVPASSWPPHLVPPFPASALAVNERDRAWVDGKTTPHPTGCFTEPLKVSGAYQAIARKTYIRTPLFKNAAFDNAMARCKQDPSWTTIVMNCGHDVMVDEPAQLTAILEGARA